MVRGNHDDPAYFNGEKISHERFRTIPDYSVIHVCDHNIFCVGGAISIDRYNRQRDDNRDRISQVASYWPDEVPMLDIMEIIMEIKLLLEYSDRSQLREWLQENHSKEKECWVVMSRSKTPPAGVLPYIDVVEEALCFGWIDSTLKKLPDGRLAQRLSPRRKKSHWTKLNMDRCIDLEDRGLMTPAGRRAFEETKI